ncbi:MAG TPA: DUF4199 family protein [Cytophagaceae bacterium]
MKIQLKYGLIIAITFATITFTILSTHLYDTFIGRFSLLLFFFPTLTICLILGIREIREKKYHNEINYAQALFGGIAISAIAALLLSALFYLFFTFAYPTEYVDFLIKANKELLEELQKSPKEIDEIIENIKTVNEPSAQAGNALTTTLIAGIIISAIASAFLRTKDTFNIQQPDKK